jgi:hypothetical protein
MNTPNPAFAIEIEALRAVLRPCAILPRAIPRPPQHQIRRIGGER